MDTLLGKNKDQKYCFACLVMVNNNSDTPLCKLTDSRGLAKNLNTTPT